MPKNILLFADGTGNEGGLLPDESRSNVYKLFRATRNGPDSSIDPRKQVAFYCTESARRLLASHHAKFVRYSNRRSVADSGTA
jgi:hypothetical protein